MQLCASPPAALGAIGVDWGTTHRRACALGTDGRCIRAVADAQGMLSARGRFESALEELLGAFGTVPATTPVVLSGMVGSAQGWVDAGYLELPLPLASLRERLVPVPSARAGVVIVPGVIGRGGTQLDVMRGEEAQLLGAVALGHADGWFVLPGTHSKWVRVESGAIVDFATYMTGELFALLSRHGTLAAAMEEGGADSHRAEAFDEGLNAAADGALSNLLFGVRARVVGAAMAACDAPSYLSGL
ncbi:MAG TPA: 2-dehydro-3-deoxygalactonokinase, partial [Burkholderiaceae bacterium]|nr:2-dehydro-3-deoxygalactonokinase [Burkholderiaceae bacterium]